jgi:hypothetical protein
MAATNDDHHIGDDMDTLTVMNEDIVMGASSPNDARYQRGVSRIPEVLEQRTNQLKQFWYLRYQVQEIHPRFHEQSQKDISARLTALHRLSRFDAEAILQIKVRRVVKELLKRISRLENDRHRLRMRSRRLMRRLSGTICAYRRWQIRESQRVKCARYMPLSKSNEFELEAGRGIPSSGRNCLR